MNTISPLQEIYQKALLETDSKSQLLGMFQGMKQMYEQDKLPNKDIQEIEKINLEPVQKLAAVLSDAVEKGEQRKQMDFDNRTDDIHLQVCLKIASEQLRSPDGKCIPSVIQINNYARDLMKEVWGE